MVNREAIHVTVVPLLPSVPLTVNTDSCAVVELGSTEIPIDSSIATESDSAVVIGKPFLVAIV